MAVPRITCKALHLRVLPSFSPPLQWTRCQTQPSGSTPARSTQLPRSHQACYRLLSLSLRLPTKRRQGGPRTPFTLCSNRQPLQKIRGKTLARRLPRPHVACCTRAAVPVSAGISSLAFIRLELLPLSRAAQICVSACCSEKFEGT